MSEIKKSCNNCAFRFSPKRNGTPCYACIGVLEWEPAEVDLHVIDNGDIKNLRSEADNLEIYKRAIKVFGQRSQVNVAIEEMSELIKELCKLNRKQQNVDHILEEIADCYIMMHQLTLIFDDPKENKVMRYIDEKTRRLEKLVQEAEL